MQMVVVVVAEVVVVPVVLVEGLSYLPLAAACSGSVC